MVLVLAEMGEARKEMGRMAPVILAVAGVELDALNPGQFNPAAEVMV